MEGSLLWLFILIAACILVPLFGAVWRQIDFQRQVSGKKKMRTLNANENIYMEEAKKNPEMEALAHEAAMRSVQDTITRTNL